MFPGSASCPADLCWKPRIWDASDGISCSKSIWRSRWIWSTQKPGRIISPPPTQLSKDGYAGQTNVAPIQYFEDMFPDAASNGVSATQNIYNNIWKYVLGNETARALCSRHPVLSGCAGKTGRYWPTQFASMYTWASIGDSNYNGGQVMLRHAMSHGFQMEFSYTYSKSMDMGSDDERTDVLAEHRQQHRQQLQRDPECVESALSYGPSDYDVRHLITGSWVVELPFGKGKWLASRSSTWLDQHDWRLAIVRAWPLDQRAAFQRDQRRGLEHQLAGEGQHHPDRRRFRPARPSCANGAPDVFANPARRWQSLKNPLPGQAGQRNNFRGDGYFGIDARLAKNWKLSERSGYAVCLGRFQRDQLRALRCEPADTRCRT